MVGYRSSGRQKCCRIFASRMSKAPRRLRPPFDPSAWFGEASGLSGLFRWVSRFISLLNPMKPKTSQKKIKNSCGFWVPFKREGEGGGLGALNPKVSPKPQDPLNPKGLLSSFACYGLFLASFFKVIPKRN